MKAHFKAFITIISFLGWWSCSTDDGIEDDPPVMIGPAIQWQKSLGGSKTDEYPIIQQTPDGGFIMAATTFSYDGDVSFLHDPGHSDAWLVKLDNTGGIIWEKSLGGSRWEIPIMILQLNDGGYLLGVSSNSADGDIKNGNLGSIDWWIVRLDAGGNILWERTLGGMLDETPHAAIQIGDEFLITGITASSDNWVSNKTNNSNDLWMVRMDDTGQLIWENTYGTPTLDEGGLALFANQDGYMVAAEASGDIWLITFDSELNITWEEYFGGSGADDLVTMISHAGGYTVLATSESSDGDVSINYGGKDIWAFHINNVGEILWEKSYGGSDKDLASSLLPSNDGGYWMIGTTESADGDLENNYGRNDYWVLKLDSSGNITWDQNYGGSTWDQTHSITTAGNNGIVVAGDSNSTNGDVQQNIGASDIWLLLIE